MNFNLIPLRVQEVNGVPGYGKTNCIMNIFEEDDSIIRTIEAAEDCGSRYCIKLATKPKKCLLLLSSDAQRKFPPNFKFGVATSAVQVEGGWNVSDKGDNVWDSYIHRHPNFVVDGTNADVACDSYHFWEQDINMLQNLGVDFYRFSISWTRILPTAFPNKISKDGVNYYNKIIDTLLEKGIQPVVTMHHFDMPQILQDFGGWANPLMADWFAEYARVLFTVFGDRIKTWITINEPIITCDYGYNYGEMPPVVVERSVAPYVCSKNLLMAHAKAWRLYDEHFRNKYHGKVAIVNNPFWIEPAAEEDRHLAELANELGGGRFSHPIYSKEGGWPPLVEALMKEYSKKLGFPYSVLPAFTDAEKEFVKGTYDFYSLNHYTTFLIRPARVHDRPGYWPFNGSLELDAILFSSPDWPITKYQGLPMVPVGIRRQIQWITERYGNVSILISETGCSSRETGLRDDLKIRFIRDYLEQLYYSIVIDGANVFGYTYWSLMDNFEFKYGYQTKFGLYEVDFKDPKRKRTPRESAHFYANVIKHHSMDVHSPTHTLKPLHRENNGVATHHSTILLLISLGLVVLYLQ